MIIRTFQPGDEAAQVTVYNTAAAALPKFKPATLPEVQRRIRARDFDPASRVYAVDASRTVVGYCTFQANGRVSFPWVLPGHEAQQEPLFEAVLTAMRQRGIERAFAAYRTDWPTVNDYFSRHGFALAREMVNYTLDFMDMPTPGGGVGSGVTPVRPEDVPAILALAPEVLRVKTAEDLHRYLFRNPYFGPEALFALRSRADNSPVAVGIVVNDPNYADPTTVDPNMPCFRLGAFGTEGMTVKRLRGLFSFIAKLEKSLFSHGMDLLGYATVQLSQDDDLAGFVAQVASDVPILHAFYQRVFRKQGGFPVYERDLTAV